MADAAIVSLHKGVTADLNVAGRFSQQIAAERKYQPSSQLEDTKNLTVQVAMAAWRVAPDNRTDWEHEFDIDIGILWRADPKQGEQAPEAFDKCLKLVEEITDYYELNRPIIADCPLVGISFGTTGDAPYHPDHIETLNQLTSIIRLTFRKWRDPSA